MYLRKCQPLKNEVPSTSSQYRLDGNELCFPTYSATDADSINMPNRTGLRKNDAVRGDKQLGKGKVIIMQLRLGFWTAGAHPKAGGGHHRISHLISQA
jgi:hypothetical protein